MISLCSTRYGPMMGLTGDMYVFRSLSVYGEYCEDEVNVLSQIIQPGMTVIEAGANIGALTIPLARRCAPARLLAFEPVQATFQLLCANLIVNGVRNVSTYADALGKTNEIAEIPQVDVNIRANFGSITAFSGPRGHFDNATAANIKTIDSLALKSCGLIKIDVEGMEEEVIIGAEDTIRRCRPVIYVENDRKNNQQAVIDATSGFDYDLYWHVVPLFNPENFNHHTEDVFVSTGAINMLCIPKEKESTVNGMEKIDPNNWKCPVELVQ